MTEPVSSVVQVPSLALGDGEAAYRSAVDAARDEDWANRLFDRDVSLWTDDADVGAAIADRLGWLDAPTDFADNIPALEAFGDAIVDAGFTTAVVAGMGGSSLAPDVLHRMFGSAEGYLDLRILDSTDPEAVTAVLDDLDPLATLVIVASKSGTTVEPNAFLAAAWERAHAALDRVGHHVYETPGAMVVAITDPGKSLDAIPHHDDFREVFLNPPDIGGRYSALTYVGLVPASLIGLDLDALLASASAMLGACREPDPDANPGLSLGIAIGTLARAGRDKLTFLPDAEIASFGSWAEQLIAESTGKHGVGIVPVDLEPVGEPAAYGDDRVFVRLALEGGTDPGHDALADALEVRRTARHPHHDQRSDRRRRGVRPLGGRDRDRRRRPRHRPVRPAQRRGSQAADPRRPGPCGAGRADDLVRAGRAGLGPGPYRPSPRPAHAATTERLPGPAGLHRSDRGTRRGHGCHPCPAPGRDAQRHHCGLWAAIPAFDRPAPQGRRTRGLVPPAHG